MTLTLGISPALFVAVFKSYMKRKIARANINMMPGVKVKNKLFFFPSIS
jgi:hypothetical protein